MKKQTLTVLILIFLSAGTYAQQTELELIRSSFNLEKIVFVTKLIHLRYTDFGNFSLFYS